MLDRMLEAFSPVTRLSFWKATALGAKSVMVLSWELSASARLAACVQGAASRRSSAAPLH